MGIDTEGGGPRDQKQSSVPEGGSQTGGGPSSDMAAPGGSSGQGGYGKAQNQENHQGQQGSTRPPAGEGQSRGERYDEAQGGGRGADSVRSMDSDIAQDQIAQDQIAQDQAAHQDRGQSVAEEESGGR